jgi:hypothetical protein
MGDWLRGQVERLWVNVFGVYATNWEFLAL